MGLEKNGSIVAWGHNNYSQCNVPAPNTDFVAVTGGVDHSLGLKKNGSIVAWGCNADGQCNVPEPNAGFVAIAGGWHYSLSLKGCLFNLVGDMNNDCKVNFIDLSIMAEDWLIDCDTNPSNPACVPK